MYISKYLHHVYSIAKQGTDSWYIILEKTKKILDVYTYIYFYAGIKARYDNFKSGRNFWIKLGKSRKFLF